uniref:Glycoside hydrolase family 1 n=1 Tax=Phyllotreta striolata TaxID=444603 RepID=A0A059UDM3_PHYSR|nr:glycoside hydrolase family 1 [Phyllotreta striolata]
MWKLPLLLVICITTVTSAVDDEDDAFDVDFSFGAATAAYQIEGAWDEDGKGETIWDRSSHATPYRFDDADADVACDSYHKYKEDVALAAKLGLTHYKFSISWARIYPTGFNNRLNTKGVLYYQNLVNELLKHNITPIATIYHWDLPQSIQDLGGWLNSNIVGYFTDYARGLFEYLPNVKYWVTINEPKQVCVGGYGKASKAPFIAMSGEGDYLCAYHVILAHASVYNLYKSQFSHLKGKISIGLDGEWNIPLNNTDENDKLAAERRLQFDFGLYANPLVFGDWPEVVKERVKERSSRENFASSRLPAFTEEQKRMINGTLDYLAVNFYDSKLVGDAKEADNSTYSYNNDVRVLIVRNTSLPAAIDGNTIYAEGFRLFLKWVDKTYKNPKILIGENGVPDDGTSIVDNDRMYYLSDYLSALLKSIKEDKVNIFGYTIWSLLDNFEWTEGYRLHYGLYSVNFTDVNRERTAKSCASFYKFIIETRRIPPLPLTSSTSTSTYSTPTTIHSSTTTGTSLAHKHSYELPLCFSFIFLLISIFK